MRAANAALTARRQRRRHVSSVSISITSVRIRTVVRVSVFIAPRNRPKTATRTPGRVTDAITNYTTPVVTTSTKRFFVFY